MNPFEYLAVLISIVLGLGLTELLASAQQLIHARDRVRFHWLPLVWSAQTFVLLVQWWWAAFGMRGQLDWHFFAFLYFLLGPMLLYLAAALVLPNVEPGARYDLRAHYFRHHRPFFGTLAVSTGLALVRAVQAADLQAAVLDGLGVALLVTLAASRNPRVHAAGTAAGAVLLVAFIVAETLRLG